MADIEPPSFSLGLDLDLDFELPCEAPDSPTGDTSAPPEDKIESCRTQTDPRPDSPPPLFRRLRRGLPTGTKELPVLSRESELPVPDSIDDDIEEFSSEELEPRSVEQTAPQAQSLCRGTKFSLHGRGLVTKQSSNGLCRKRKQDLDAPSTSSVAERGKTIFSDVTMSPVRRFQLIDSDSEGTSDFEDAGVHGHGIKVTNKRATNLSCSAAAGGKKSDSSASKLQKVDFWKDFHPEEICNVSTPALDEFCQEYFRAPKDTKQGPELVRGKCQTQGGQNNIVTSGAEKLKQTDLGHALPPAHHYFFHDDPRIQRLVQSRLCHFQPLFPASSEGNQHHNASIIDYRSQFNNEGNSKQKRTTKANPQSSSRKAGNSSKSSCGKRSTNSTEKWVTPKSSVDLPKDANRKRVHASGGSVGKWYTDENGMKVYVSKNGQEFTGQSAYRCYKKDSGGFGKSKRKTKSRGKK